MENHDHFKTMADNESQLRVCNAESATAVLMHVMVHQQWNVIQGYVYSLTWGSRYGGMGNRRGASQASILNSSRCADKWKDARLGEVLQGLQRK